MEELGASGLIPHYEQITDAQGSFVSVVPSLLKDVKYET